MELTNQQLAELAAHCQHWTVEGAITILDRAGWTCFTYDTMREALEATLASGRIRRSDLRGYDYTLAPRRKYTSHA